MINVIFLEDKSYFDINENVKLLKIMLLLYGLLSDIFFYMRYMSIECYVNIY